MYAHRAGRLTINESDDDAMLEQRIIIVGSYEYLSMHRFGRNNRMLLQINRDLLVRVVIDSRSKSSKSKLCDTFGRDSDGSGFNSFKYCGYFTVVQIR